MPIWQKEFKPEALFTEAFLTLNYLGGNGFISWVFHPDMLFGARQNWWGAKKPRPRPHEGIDLCLYRDGRDKIINLNEGVGVPAAHEGRVVKVIDDFLGRSIFMEHRFPEINPGVFLTFYGHTLPADGIIPGCSVKQGQLIATVAPPKNSVPPHLHVTAAWSSNSPAYDTLDWSNISDPERLQLLDPLQILGGLYELLGTSQAPEVDSLFLKRYFSKGNR